MMNIREKKEASEEAGLSEYAAKSRLSKGRDRYEQNTYNKR